jgi:hypothetical protein
VYVTVSYETLWWMFGKTVELDWGRLRYEFMCKFTKKARGVPVCSRYGVQLCSLVIR